MAKKSKAAGPVLDLGLSIEKLREVVIERATAQLVASVRDRDYSHSMEGIINNATAAAVKEYADQVVLPQVRDQLEDVCFQMTNEYGEKKGEKMTFRQFLVNRADAWMTEPVDFRGKTKAEVYGGSWSKYQTRVAHLVHEHLHFSIRHAIETALKDMNSKVATGLAETVKTQLALVLAGLKVSVSTK